MKDGHTKTVLLLFFSQYINLDFTMCNIRTTFTHNETMIIDALKSISYFYTQTHFDWKCIRLQFKQHSI